MTRHPISLRQITLGAALILVLACILGLAAILTPVANSALAVTATARPLTPITVSGETLCSRFINAKVDPTISPRLYEIQQQRYKACLQAYNTRLTPMPVPARVMTFEAPHTFFAPTAVVPRTPAGVGTILDHPASPLGPFYEIENSWVFEVPGKTYQVFAGAKREEGPPQPRNAKQGIVVVWVWGSEGITLPDGGYYYMPIKKGPVKIVGAQGQRLVLKTDDGATFYFDFPSRRFVSSLTEIVPTITPLATPTRKPYP